MKIATPNLHLTDSGITQEEELQLLASANALAVFLPDDPPEGELPVLVYLPVYTPGGKFLGAAALEKHYSNVGVMVHIMMLERSRKLFAEVCELTVMWCLHKQLSCFTRVPASNEYAYMQNFVEELGYIECCGEAYLEYTLPRDWKPVFLTSVIMEF